MNIIEGKLALSGKEKVAIINSRFNHIITDRLVGYRDWETDRKSTRLNSSHITRSRIPSSS